MKSYIIWEGGGGEICNMEEKGASQVFQFKKTEAI